MKSRSLCWFILLATGCGGAGPGATVNDDEPATSGPGARPTEVTRPASDPANPPTSPGSAPPSGPGDGAAVVPEPAPLKGNPAAALPPRRTVDEAAQRELEAGRAAAAAGDLATAQARFSGVASQGVAEGHYNLGVIAEWQARKQTAREAYDRALAAEPEFGPAVVAIARLMLRNNDGSGAMRMAEDRLRARPESLELRNALDQVRLLAGADARAVSESAKLVLRKDEKNVAAMTNLARAYQLEGKHELAVAILDNTAVLSPDDPEIPFLQALSFDALKEPRRARAALEAAVSKPGGGSAEAHNNLGLLYHEAGDFVGAEAQFRKAIGYWPEMLAAHTNLGNALKGQQRYADADAALKQALSLSKDDPDVHFNLGILYLDGNMPGIEGAARFERAVEYFERYKTLRRNAPSDDPVDRYIAEARKRIEVERKRQEQQRNAPKPPPADGEGAE